jgi:hypothetical protein
MNIIRLKITPTNNFVGLDSSSGDWYMLDQRCTMILYKIADQDVILSASGIPAQTAHVLIKNLKRGIL